MINPVSLVIVESPTKARTLSRFLSSRYQLAFSLGHVRDLPEKRLGIDTAHDFQPEYIVNPEKKKIVKELKKQARLAQNIILATDPDREGEAIAYHLRDVISSSSKLRRERENIFKRVVFHEITREAVLEALKTPRSLDMDLVNAQQARRLLDRLVGYKLSPLLWRKIRRGLSAGRVQSLAVRFVVEREREREKFKPEEHWQILADFDLPEGQSILEAHLVAKNGKPYELSLKHDLFDGSYTVKKTSLESEEETKRVIADLKAPFTVKSAEEKEIRKNPPPPFITATLQTVAAQTLNFSAKKTMSLAQRLYEEGLITYHRTDSLNLSEKFLAAAQEFIREQYGQKFSSGKRRFKTRAKVAQEAHEAIRPTDVKIQVQSPKFKTQKGFDGDKDKERLYDLIWRRALASQATPAVFDSTKIQISSANNYLFQATGSVVKFEGYLKITGRALEDKILPKVKVGQKLKLTKTQALQKFTSPPPRYSQASLIKALERHGVGRPSTYAPIISTILDRHYVELEEGKFKPTLLGLPVNDFLVAHFPKIVDIPFTAHMEDDLDKIANGKTQWVLVLKKFYQPFAKKLEIVAETVKRVKIEAQELKEDCPQCAKSLVIRTGRFGRFIACSGFPNCRYTRRLVQKLAIKCPECRQGEVIVKQARTQKGSRKFYGCSRYPKCHWASWKRPFNSQPSPSTINH